MIGKGGEIILFTADDGVRVQLRAREGTVWLPYEDIAALYGTSRTNIVQIIRRIYADEELSRATCNSELQVRQEGKRQVRREVYYFNLDMILAIGYRATTPRAVQFRQWATSVLHEYLQKGFVMDDERLKDPGGDDYFDEIVERIRDIRASEKRFYQKVRELFAATSADYDKTAETARAFFAAIQNKLLFAVTGRTAAEIVVERSDAQARDMGLTNHPKPFVRRADVTIAKNYLNETEISDLNLLTNLFLDFAESRARRRQELTMAEWVKQTDLILTTDGRAVLTGRGRVSAEDAEQLALQRFDRFDLDRRALEAAAAEREEESDTVELLSQRLAKLEKPKDKPAKKPK
ncbi:DNA-binding protein [Betaproteobacteria bacterium]|nr:DNA-binding protein [Betaproteobacteria bacterium]